MIIQQTFHTYKDNFPLLINNQLRLDFDYLITGLILELSELSSLPLFAYMARHSTDKIPQKYLDPFLSKFHDFVNHHGQNQQYNIPTVWFVGYFDKEDLITEVRRRLDEKNVKYFEESNKYDSFESIKQRYYDNTKDARLFLKFLHQVTKIGIDLLSVPDYRQKLNSLKPLEKMKFHYKSVESRERDLMQMEQYLRQNSQYYQKYISTEETELKKFWNNFQKVKATNMSDGTVSLCSWPHFLFNICGV